MEELLLINPSKRPRKRKSKGTTKMARKTRRTRSAAQKRATARMLAANRARRGGAKRRTVKARRSHAVYAANPAPRRRKYKRNPIAARANPRRRRHYKRNPASLGIMPLLTEATIGAAGALAVNTAVNWLPLPDALNTGLAKQAVKGAAAVALGLFGGMVLPRATARKMAAGSLTVTVHEILQSTLSGMLPSAKLGFYPGGAPAPDMSRLMLANPARQSMGTNTMAGMSEYIRKTEMQGMGEYL